MTLTMTLTIPIPPENIAKCGIEVAMFRHKRGKPINPFDNFSNPDDSGEPSFAD
jgi:hypothetical protein